MNRQRGLSISELLVAVAIGTIITLLAVTIMASASAGYVAHTDAANIDDGGRFALAAIEKAARQTGFADWEQGDAGSDPAAPPAIIGLDAASLSSDSDGISKARPAAVNGSDVLAMRFAGSGSAGGDGSMTTCAGFSVGAGQEGWSIFYVGINAKNEPELRCKYRGANNWSAEAIVGGVDSFQVLYGLDTDSQPDGQANRFVTASAITELDAVIAPEGATDVARARAQLRKSHWKRVVSIKVSVVLHGAQRSKNAAAQSVFHLFGVAYNGASDAGSRIDRAAIPAPVRERERRMFSSTIMLRNSVR